MNYTLSDQALASIMMALQKSLIEQSDIVPVLKGLQIQIDDSNQLVVVNPPTFEINELNLEQEEQTISTSVQ